MRLQLNVDFEGRERVPLGNHEVPRVWTFRQTDQEGEWPTLTLRVEIREGAPSIREVRISSTADGMEVQSAHLRETRLEDLVEYMAGVVVQEVSIREEMPEGEGELTVEDVTQARRDGKRAARDVRRTRRRTVTGSMLAEVARVYREAEGAPVRAVEEHFGKTRRTASWYVKQAREAGLLDNEGDI